MTLIRDSRPGNAGLAGELARLLSRHDPAGESPPESAERRGQLDPAPRRRWPHPLSRKLRHVRADASRAASSPGSAGGQAGGLVVEAGPELLALGDRKSTRLNSSN